NNAPTIKFGERDTQAVRAIQQAYIDLGFAMPVSTMKGSPDGIFGAETQKVTRAFQTKNKLSPDGIVGHDTMAKLDELFPEKPADVPFTPSKALMFQPLRRMEGWDGSVSPFWHMVPQGG